MNTLKILSSYCDPKSKKKTFFFLENDYYSEIVEFSLSGFLKKVFLLVFRKLLFYLGKVNSNTCVKIIKIDEDIFAIKGNYVEKSLVVIKKDCVIKVYKDCSISLKSFYKNSYNDFCNVNKGDVFSVPPIQSINDEDEFFTIIFDKINSLNKSVPLSEVKATSDRLTQVLSNLSLTDLEEEQEIPKKTRVTEQIDKLISDKLTEVDDYVLSHGDFWRGNLLIDENDKIQIIDFDNLAKFPRNFDFVYYLLSEVTLENKNFFLKVLKNEPIKYTKIKEYLDLGKDLKNLNINEFLFIAIKFRYNLLNNENYTPYKNEIIQLLSKISSGYSILNNIDKNE